VEGGRAGISENWSGDYQHSQQYFMTAHSSFMFTRHNSEIGLKDDMHTLRKIELTCAIDLADIQEIMMSTVAGQSRPKKRRYTVC
jgi:hypothetical protein